MELGNAPHGDFMTKRTVRSSTTSVLSTKVRPIDVSSEAWKKSKFCFTAAALNFSPLWNVTFGRSFTVHSVFLSLGVQDRASQGCACLSAPMAARGSSTDEPTRFPLSVHWFDEGL